MIRGASSVVGPRITTGCGGGASSTSGQDTGGGATDVSVLGEVFERTPSQAAPATGGGQLPRTGFAVVVAVAALLLAAGGLVLTVGKGPLALLRR